MIELTDLYSETLTPVFRFKPEFYIRRGVFSKIERDLLKMKSQSVSEIIVNGSRDRIFYEKFLHKHFNNKVKLTIVEEEPAPKKLTEAKFIKDIGNEIIDDVLLLNRENFPSKNQNVLIEGNRDDAWIHKDAVCSAQCCLDTTNGPVIIDEGCQVSAFSLIKGPAYIGKFSILDKVQLDTVTTGVHNRLGGEISNSYIGDYSNKHHEGFLGHSIVGDWVNLGALTTTSDLKNNYGVIKLTFEDQKYDTGEIKFGSIIGDFVKTAIGTMLNTGTIIDVATLLFQGHPQLKYYPPFFWGGANPTKYKLNRFITDLKLIMKRRAQKPDQLLLAQIKALY